jgi:hypothetical protein
MQIAPVATPSDPATVAGAMIWAYQYVTGRAPPSRSSWLLPLAQSAFETANWQQMYSWNVGYISQPNKSQPYYFRGSNPVPFAVYPTLGQGCAALIRWLQRTGALAGADANNLQTYGAALQSGGYLGSDPSQYPAYLAGIQSEMQRYANVVPTPYSEGGVVPVNTTNWQALGLAALVLGAAGVAAYAIHPATASRARAWPRAGRRRSTAMENPRRRGRKSDVQSLMFSRKAGWTKMQAQAWAKQHGFHYGSPDVTANQIHIRQAPAGRFKRVATKSFGGGIQARIGFR